MALDPANYIDELSITDPTSSDLVSQGDDQIRTVKRAVKQSFPSVDIAVNAIHTSSSAPTVSLAEGLVWIDTSGGAGAHVAKIYDGGSFITLPFSVETAQKVDVNDGTIDGTIIGGSSAAAGTFAALEGTTVKATTSLTLDTAATVIFEGATADAYETTLTVTDPTADRTVTIQNATDTLVGRATTDTLTNKTMTSSGNTFDDATTSAKGMASFSSDNFGVSSGAVTIKDAGVAFAEIQAVAGNSILGRNASDSGVLTEVAIADTELLIGDGTGFATNTLSKDATLLSTGALTVTGIQGKAVSSTAPTDDQMLKYTTAGSGEWQMVSIIGDDKLTTKGDVLTYNTVDSETRMAVGTDDYVLMADAGASNNNGIDWKQIATASIADNAVTLGKLEDGTQGDILYYGASGAPARLGFGTSGYVLKTQGTGANPAWAADTDTTYTAGDGLDLTGTAFSTDLKSTGGLAIDTTELTIDFTSDNSWTGSQRATLLTDNDGSFDMNGAQNFKCTPTGDVELTFTNFANGQSGFVILDNSGGHAISRHGDTIADANFVSTVSAAGTYIISYISDGADAFLTNSAIMA
jgi:hypothetical protein